MTSLMTPNQHKKMENNIIIASLKKNETMGKLINTVSHFSYAPFFQAPHFLTKILESNILYDNSFIDILSV